MPLPALRSRLLLLALGSMVPLLLLSLLLAWLLLQREEALVRDGAMDRCRAVASALDARLDGHLAALRALGAAQALEGGRLQDFLVAARRVKASQPYWRNVLLVDGGARQRLNLRLDRLDALPREAPREQASLQQVLGSGNPHIGDVGQGPLATRVAVALQVRVQVAGEPMALKLILEPEAFASLLEAQHLPPQWAAAVIDGNGRFVVRKPNRPAGTPIAEGLWQAVRQAGSGWVRTRTLEGTDTHQAFVHSSVSAWTVAVAIPRAEVLAGTRDAARWLAVGTLLSLALAGGLALTMARRVAAPIRALAQAAGELGRDGCGALPSVRRHPGFAEALAVAQALDGAEQSIREREALREREQAALREADRAKDEFVAMLGHELRNPLSAIAASAQVLRLAPPGGGAERAHHVIERQVQQMTRLVEDLLDISRLATGKLRLERTPADLLSVVRQSVQGWQQAQVPPHSPVQVSGQRVWAEIDRARVEQIVVNLLDNARKFSPPGGPIEVQVTAAPPWAVLAVRDHGQGVPAEDLSRIFDTFYQARPAGQRPQGGLGLGLSLVRRLSELHGGDAAAASQGPGGGTLFTVRLPLAQAPAPPLHAPQPAHEPSAQRILVVEDNDDGRAMLTLLLEIDGHEVRAVGSAAAALETLTGWRPDIALIDIGLPDLDGRTLARRIQALALTPPPRLVALSGFGQPEDAAQSLDAGFALHLTKPVQPDALRQLLAEPIPAPTQ